MFADTIVGDAVVAAGVTLVLESLLVLGGC